MTKSETIDAAEKLRAILYDAAGHDRAVDLQKIKIEELGNEQLLWVDVAGSKVTVPPEQMQSALGSTDEVGSLEIFDEFYRFCIPLLDPKAS